MGMGHEALRLGQRREPWVVAGPQTGKQTWGFRLLRFLARKMPEALSLLAPLLLLAWTT